MRRKVKVIVKDTGCIGVFFAKHCVRSEIVYFLHIYVQFGMFANTGFLFFSDSLLSLALNSHALPVVKQLSNRYLSPLPVCISLVERLHLACNTLFRQHVKHRSRRSCRALAAAFWCMPWEGSTTRVKPNSSHAAQTPKFCQERLIDVVFICRPRS